MHAPADLPCVGRDSELAGYLRALSEAEQGHGSGWIVTGPAGIGKSRLLRRVADLGRQRGFDVRWGYGLEGSVSPLTLFRQVLASATKPPDGESPMGRRDSEGESSRPVDLATFETLGQLAEAGARQPQLLLLDDVEAADPESLRCLELLGRSLADRRIVVVAASRVDGSLEAPNAVRPALLALRRAGHFSWAELPPLSAEAGIQLASLLLEQPLSSLRGSPSLVELVRVSEGSPYFLIELVSRWGEQAAPAAQLGRATPPLGAERSALSDVELLPPIRSVVQDRLARLSGEERRLLVTAAHLGLEFSAEPIAAGTGTPLAQVDAKLRAVLRRGGPIVAGAQRYRYAFRHGLDRDVLLAERSQGPPFGPSLVRWWAAHRPDDPVTEARLRAAIGDRPGALACVRRATSVLLARSAYRSLLELLAGENAVLSLGSSPELGRFLLGVVGQLRDRLESDWAGEVLRRLPLEQLPAELRWTAYVWLIENTAFRDAEGARSALRALEQATAPGGWAEGAADRRALLPYLRALVDFPVASPQISMVPAFLAAARGLDARRHALERARLLYLAILFAAQDARWTTARRAVSELRRTLAADRRPSLAVRHLVRSGEGFLAYELGEIDRACRIERPLLRQYRRRGELGLEARSLMNAASYELPARRLAAARRHLQRAEEILSVLGNPRQLAACRTLQGWAEILEGRWDAAENTFRAIEHLETGSDPGSSRWAAEVGLALLDAERGHADRALRRLDALHPRPGLLPDSYRTEYYSSRARALELSGDREAARRLLTDVLARIRAPAADRAELIAQLVRWHGSYGDRTGRRRWERRWGELPRGIRQGGPDRWRWIGSFGRTVPTPRGPRHAGEPPRLEPGPRVRERLIGLLRATFEAGDPGAHAPALSEAELAARGGIPRDRLARTLRRLCAEGAVERLRVRSIGRERQVYVYRLAQIDAAGRPSGSPPGPERSLGPLPAPSQGRAGVPKLVGALPPLRLGTSLLPASPRSGGTTEGSPTTTVDLRSAPTSGRRSAARPRPSREPDPSRELER
ncbi:MAG TPA: AAA family ATPase [Thermoplasmata archaeon]|nr:AAA family ATPase [Thermoplasmata archaeon]